MIVSMGWLCGWFTLIVLVDASVVLQWGGWLSACQLGLITALGIGLWRTPQESLVVGLWGGLVADSVSASPFGSAAILFGLAAWGTARLRRHLYKDHPLVQATLAAVVAWIGWSIGWYFTEVGSAGPEPIGAWVRGSIASSLVTALASPAWLRLIRPILVRRW